jgi:hypothetical protein
LDRLAEPANIAVFVLTVVVLILLFSTRRSSSVASLPTIERRLAYEEMWQTQESELWEWIEERVGLHNIREPSASDNQKLPWVSSAKKKVDSIANLGGMAEREVLEAIRVTKERLGRLEGMVKKENGKREDVPNGKAEL